MDRQTEVTLMDRRDLEEISQSRIVKALQESNDPSSKKLLKILYEKDMQARRHYLGLVRNIDKTWNLNNKRNRGS